MAGITATAILLAYVLTAYDYEQDRIDNRAEFAAAEVAKLVNASPSAWTYEEQRLNELPTSITSRSILHTRSTNLCVLDAQGALIVEVGLPVPSPFIVTTRPVTDGLAMVGRVELTEGVTYIWLNAIPVAVIGLVLAIVIFVVLRVLPLRALLRREAALEAARQVNRENEMQIRLVSDAMPVLIGYIIGYIDSDNCVHVMNRIGEEWYARPRADIIGRPILNILPSTLGGQLSSYMAAALAGNAVSFEHAATYPDGIPRQVRGNYIPHIGPNGEIQGYFALVEDVTARRETEEQLREAQKTGAVGQLTGGIAHDFNNLLGIILGNIEMLREQFAEIPETLSVINAALNACLRGGELTQRLFAFSRKQALTPRVMVVNDLIANTAVLLRRTIASSIRIDTAPAKDLWPCSVDAGQLENAIVNLSINARDAMLGGGKLTIETANVECADDVAHADIGGLAPGSYVSITVTDTGAGMTPEVVAHAFEPFFTTKEVGKGSGLGPSMVYGFAKQSGGQAKIYSEVGEGANARKYLPKAKADEGFDTSDQPGTAAIAAGCGEAILVVEDAEDLRRVAVAHLRSLGYTVLQAGEGHTALALPKERPDIDLLITDIMMPEADGIETIIALRRKNPDIPIIVVSGGGRLGDMDYLVLAKNLDATQSLAKPFRRQQLVDAVRTILRAPATA